MLWPSLHAQPVKRYSFIHQGVSAGLASNEVTTVAQDEMGYMWIGTNNGLQRFDGIRYKTFRPRKNDPSSLPDNYILQALYDKKKNLWLITGDGKVGIFDTHNFTYREIKVKIKNEQFLQQNRKLIMDEEGNLFLLFNYFGFVTWSEKKQEFSEDYNIISVPADWKVLDLIQQPGTKKYWIGTTEGMAIYDRQTNQLSYAGHNVRKEGFFDSRLAAITGPGHFLFDSHNRLWFDSWLGGTPLVYVYDANKNEPLIEKYNLSTLLKTYYEIKSFVQQKNGTIWINGLGLFARYLDKEKQFQIVYNGYENEQSISYSRVDFLFEDKEANIWVATNNNGLYHFNPAAQFFTNIRQTNRLSGKPGDGSMMSFIQTRQGTLFAGAWTDGLYHFDRNYTMIPLNIRGFDEKIAPFAWSLFPSRDSNIIWMGTQPGIFAINQATHSASYYNPPVMQNRTVRQVAEDKYGNLWMGTQSLGLFKWTAEKGKRKFNDGVAQYTNIPITQVLKIFIDKKGYIWVATSGFGVYVIDPANDKMILHFGMKEPPERKLLWDGAASVLQYDDTIMAIAANGIYLFNTRQQKIIKTINMPESIPGIIAAMEKDRNGYLWISTTNGIFRLNPKNNIFIHFDRIDGIANDLFVTAASYVLPDGKILFGADNQFVVFDPQQVRINEPAPDVTITDFKLMNESLLVDSLLKQNRIELSPEDNSITIDFSGLNYNGTYIIKYKLEGLDKEWKRADQFNQAIYSYLPPGHYTFMAKSEDAEGNPSKNITKFVIQVKPPFWKTWWFLGLIVFALVGLLFGFDKQRMQKFRATESIRTRIATSLTEDMSNSLSSINISSELAKTKMDTDTERTKEYIAQISETSNRMVQAMYDMVWSIDPKNDTMLHTIERMKSFAVETESLYDIDIVFDIDEFAADLDLDMAHRYELLSIFKESIINVAKHSTARHVQVTLRLKNSRFFMLIEDDGKGFDTDKSTLGRGINDMRRRASNINATLYIESEKNTGTIVKLEMPV